MPGALGMNLNLCFSKIKRPASPESSVPGRRDQNRPLSSDSPASILIKNFNSLYDFTFECTTASTTAKSGDAFDDFSSDSDGEEATTPDFASAFASQRFFFSSPGSSNSIIDSASASSSSSSGSGSYLAASSPVDPPEPENLVGGSIAIPTDSPDPFVDFRRSMQEMVEANDMIDVRNNWDYLHELLMCYLSLNPKSNHKFIVGAFSDLLVSLMTPSPEDGRRKSSSSDDGDVDGRGNISRGNACN